LWFSKIAWNFPFVSYFYEVLYRILIIISFVIVLFCRLKVVFSLPQVNPQGMFYITSSYDYRTQYLLNTDDQETF